VPGMKPTVGGTGDRPANLRRCLGPATREP
jgi:hypothetical protein